MDWNTYIEESAWLRDYQRDEMIGKSWREWDRPEQIDCTAYSPQIPRSMQFPEPVTVRAVPGGCATVPRTSAPLPAADASQGAASPTASPSL